MPSPNRTCKGSADPMACERKACLSDTSNYVWVAILIVIMITGLVNNVVLLRVLLKGKRSASQILGINASVVNIVFTFSMSIEIYSMLAEPGGIVMSLADVFFSLIIFTCPFLLASMCVERYVAVARPISYLQLNKPEYRAAWSLLVCALTVIIAGLLYHFHLFNMLLTLSILSFSFFTVMLACLLGIIWVLCQKNPAQGNADISPMKRKALVNVLVVLVPAVLTYSPGFLVFFFNTWDTMDCPLLLSLTGVLKFGVFIAPMLYVSRTKSVTFCKGRRENPEDRKDTGRAVE